MQKKKVSVIVLTKNSVKTIGSCLNSIFQQTLSPDEVLIIDGISQDGTLEVIKEYPVKLVSEPNLGYGFARNVGLTTASGEIVAFVDSDCVLEKNYLKELIAVLTSKQDIAGVGGIVYSKERNYISESFNVRLFGISSFETEIREVDSISGGTCAYPKDLLIKVGGFNSEIKGGEDFELNFRLRKSGYKLLVVPSARTYHYHPTSISRLITKWFSYGEFLVDMSLKNNLKRDLFFSWGWLLVCISLFLFSIFNGFLLGWLLFLSVFFTPWIVYYSSQTIKFWLKNRKMKYIFLPLIHQILIISRTVGVVFATLKYPFKTKQRLKKREGLCI